MFCFRTFIQCLYSIVCYDRNQKKLPLDVIITMSEYLVAVKCPVSRTLSYIYHYSKVLKTCLRMTEYSVKLVDFALIYDNLYTVHRLFVDIVEVIRLWKTYVTGNDTANMHYTVRIKLLFK